MLIMFIHHIHRRIENLLRGQFLAAAVFCALLIPGAAWAEEVVPVLSDRQFDREVSQIVEAYDEPVTKAQAARDPYLSGRLILKSDDSTVDPYAMGAVEAVQDIDGHYIIQFSSPEDAEQAAAELQELPGTVYVEPDMYLAAADEDDPGEGSGVSCWGTDYVGAPDYVNYLNQGGAASTGTVRIAVVDSGVQKTHELLSGLIDDTYEKDFADNDNDASDTSGHGTFIAGIIAQCVRGLANIRIIPVRVMTGSTVSTAAFVNGIRHIAGKVNYTNGTSGYRTRADVMNLSIVSTAPSTSQYLTEYIAQAAMAGCTVVIAAGNSAGNTAEYPPANITDQQAPGTIIVSSCTQTGEPCVTFTAGKGSNYGDSVDLSAPGTNLTSSDAGSDSAYKSGSGTSYSAPFVSAAAAMLKTAYPSATPAQIEAALEGSTSAFTVTTENRYGSGILNMKSLIPDDGHEADLQAARAVIDMIASLPSDITLADKTDVEAARSAFNDLTAKQKLLVSNISVLEKAEQKIAELEAAAVTAMIDALPDPVTAEDEAAVQQARTAYDALTEKQKKLITNLSVLEAAEKIIADLKAAGSVMALISALPSDITLDDRADVEAARSAYSALTEAQKQLVSNLSVLEQAEQSITDQQAVVDAVISRIDALPSDVTPDNRVDVEAARSAFDSLTAVQQRHVSNLSVLEQAEKSIADQESAAAVAAMISALPSDITLDDKTAVEAARSAYMALTEDQKLLVSNLSVLEQAEQGLADQQAAVDAVISRIDALPSDITPDKRADVEAARSAFDALTSVQQNHVSNLSVLEQAEKSIADQEAAAAVAALIDALPSDITPDDEAQVEAARSAYDALTDDQKRLVGNAGRLEAAEETLRRLLVPYASSDPKPNVTYRIPLKRKQKITVLRVVGLADGDHIVSWKSSDKKKAKVSGKEDGTCVIRAGKKTGRVKITAGTASGKKIVFNLRVQKNKVKTKKLKAQRREITLAAGNTQQIDITRNPISSKEKITYLSRNKSVAVVSKNGVIRAVSPGRAVILVTSGKAKIKITVTVTN